MQGLGFLLGILLGLRNVGGTTGVIDISEYRSNRLFSGPTKVGEASFYKYVSTDNGLYSKVFDREYQVFPVRSHTRLVSMVLGLKEDSLELMQVMYSDVTKDYRIGNLYYSKKDGEWSLVDTETYQSKLDKLKNNLLTFDIKKPENKHFEKLKEPKTEGFSTYVPEKGYEIEKLTVGQTTLWTRVPSYEFKFLEVNEKPEGPDRIRLAYSNYCSEVSQYYKKTRERWIFDSTERVLDLLSLWTHGWQRKKEAKDRKPEGNDSYHKLLLEGEKKFGTKKVPLLASDIFDVEEDHVLERLTVNLNFDNSKEHFMTTHYYNLYDVNSYEFFKLSGCRVESIAYDGKPIWEFEREDYEKFHHFRVSYVEDYPVLLFSLTKVMPKWVCNPLKEACSDLPYEYSNTFYKKSEKGWICLEQLGYFSELNQMLDSASKLKGKRRMDSPPVVNLNPTTPSLDYGGRETFTHDLNLKNESKFTRELLSVKPELIMMKVRPEYALNVVVDGPNVLWEQKESGAGCVIIYVYKTESELLAHLMIDSTTEPHLFFRYTVNMWFQVTQKEYESSRDFNKSSLNFFRKKTGPVDEYTLPNKPKKSEPELKPEEPQVNANLENSQYFENQKYDFFRIW